PRPLFGGRLDDPGGGLRLVEHHDLRLVPRHDFRLVGRYDHPHDLRFVVPDDRLLRDRLLDDLMDAACGPFGYPGGARLRPIPFDAIQVEARRAVGLDVAELEELDCREPEQTHLPHERLQQPLGHEDDPRWPFGSSRLGYELLNRLGILETPRVRFERPQEHRVVGGEAERDQHGPLPAVDPDELDARPPEIEIRPDDLETRLYRFGILRDERRELVQILDFAALEG